MKPEQTKLLPSKKLQSVLKRGVLNFKKGIDFVREALELGKAEGFTAKQMGDMIKEEMLNAGISLRTIQNYLPAEAKGKPRGATTTINLEKRTETVEEKKGGQEEEFSAKSAQNEFVSAPEPNQDQPQASQEPVEQLESVPENPDPPQQQEREEENYEPLTTTKYEIKPEDYIIADLPNYDWTLLIEIIKYLDNNASKFNELTSKWQRKYEEYVEEKKALKAEIEVLKEENKKLKLSKAREVTNQVFSKVAEKQAQNQLKKKERDHPPLERATQIVQSEGIKSRRQWRNYCKANPELHLPQKADEVYGISWREFFGKSASRLNVKSEASGVVSALAT